MNNTGVLVRGNFTGYTVPASAFSADANTLDLWHLDGDATDAGSAAISGAVIRGTAAYAAGKFGQAVSGVVLGFPSAASSLASGSNLQTGTVEGWVKIAAAGATNKVAFGRDNGWFYVGINTAGQLIGQAGNVLLTSSVVVTDNAWHHVAVVFSGSSAGLLLDGSLVATTTALTSVAASSYSGFGIGGFASNANQFDWTGSVDEVRISSVARYAVTQTATFNSGAGKFGSGLAVGVYSLPAGADSFLATATAGASIGSGTIEGWVRSTATSLRVAFGRSGFWWAGQDATGKAIFAVGNSGVKTTSVTINDGQWHHLAIVVNAGLGIFYVDGTPAFTDTAARVVNGSFGTFAQIGNYGGNTLTPAYDWFGDGSGAIDEVRISNSVRYSGSSFAVPTAAFSADNRSSALYHLESDASDSATVALSSPPTVGTITRATSGANDVITYPAPTAGTNPIGGVVLISRTTSGVDAGTIVATNTGTSGGSFTQPTPAKGQRFYVVKAFDNGGSSAQYSAPSNELVLGSPAVFGPLDSGIVFSPYTWDRSSSRALSPNGGAYFRTLIFGATTVTLNFDVSNAANPASIIAYRIDRQGGWTRVPIAASVVIPIPSATSGWPKHLLEVVLDSTSEAVNRWSSPYLTSAKFTGLALSPDGTISAPGRAKLRGICLGDSITEGINTLSSSGDATVRSSATLGWAFALGEVLGAEIGVVGFGRQGLAVVGNGGVPILGTTWNQIANGISRSFTDFPDFAVVNIGTNDQRNSVSPAGFQAALTALLNSMFSTLPVKTKILVMLPFGGFYGAAPYQAAIAASDAPKRCTFVDTTGWWDSADASDALHPYGYVNVATLAPLAGEAVRAALTKGSTYVKRADGSLKAVAGPRV